MTPNPRAAHTLASPHLKRAQRLHAQAVTFVHLAGVVLAIGLLLWGPGLGMVEVGLFLGMFVPTFIGVSAGFHRHFTHRSFKAATWVRVALAGLGSMAMQGSVIFWASQHRRHHAHSDRAGDPHSPYVTEDGRDHRSSLRGFWHSYVGWTFDHDVPNAMFYAPDLIRDRAIARVNRRYFVWVALGLLIPTVLGAALHGSWAGALSGLVWGGLLRILWGHNMIWSITSLTHIFGRRDFESRDRSTNTWWLAVPTLGEAWHNNHHAFPRAAILSFRWWQIDISGLFIAALERCALAWDVSRPTAAVMEKKRIS